MMHFYFLEVVPVNVKTRTRKLTAMAIMIAISVVLVYFIHIPIFPQVAFLEYDPADISILICGFAFGPVAGICVTIIASLIQGLTVSAQSGVGQEQVVVTGEQVNVGVVLADVTEESQIGIGELGAGDVGVGENLLEGIPGQMHVGASGNVVHIKGQGAVIGESGEVVHIALLGVAKVHGSGGADGLAAAVGAELGKLDELFDDVGADVGNAARSPAVSAMVLIMAFLSSVRMLWFSPVLPLMKRPSTPERTMLCSTARRVASMLGFPFLSKQDTMAE